jgi:hypothetical protein
MSHQNKRVPTKTNPAHPKSSQERELNSVLKTSEKTGVKSKKDSDTINH